MGGFSFPGGFSLAGGGTPSGSAGGDLGGTYPNPTVINISHVTTGVLPSANGGTSVANTGSLTFSGNPIFSSPTAATTNFGAADVAAPVAQTVGVQGVVTGTLNTAGALWTFKDSNGTGTGGSGGYAWFTAAPGSSGSTPLTQTSKLTLNAAGNLTNTGNTQATNLIATASIAAGGSGSYSWTGRGVISSPSAGSVQFGNSDAASPVAQTITVQNVATGTSNTSGQNWTLTGSRSTGSGTSGDIIFQTGGTGAGAAVQNSPVSALTIKGVTQAVVIASGKTFQLGNAAATGLAAGVLAATTNATLVLTDSTGQAYRIPCII